MKDSDWRTAAMKDVFEQNSTRPNYQLLGATSSVPSGHSKLEQMKNDGSLDEQPELQREAEGMVHYLLVQSKKPALLVESRWTPAGESCAFLKEPIFREVAEAAGCITHLQTCPDEGGTRHMLFIGKSKALTDADYLDCLPSTLPLLC